MAKVPYIGVDGVARKCKSLHIGVDGVARKVKSAYIGVDGVARQFYCSSKPLSSFAEGDIVYINENGSPVEFYVIKHDYESELNGAGRTLLWRCKTYGVQQWNSDEKWNADESAALEYSTSDIDSWLNSTYKDLLDADIQDAIGTTEFYYTKPGSSDVSTLKRSIFLLSATELGRTAYCNVEGSELPIAIALTENDKYEQTGKSLAYWLRSLTVNLNTQRVYYWHASSPFIAHTVPTKNWQARPAFTLPSNTLVIGKS